MAGRSFTDPHTVEVDTADGPAVLKGEHMLIACGTRPAHSATVPLDGERIIDSDQLLAGKTLPRDLIVVGAGVIGLEYASMVTALNIKVTVIEAQPTILDFVDTEMIEALMFFMRQRGATFRLGEKVARSVTTKRNASSRTSRAARRSTATRSSTAWAGRPTRTS